jgi:hypothetical protein
MTAKHVIEQGPRFRHERGTPDKLACINSLTLARWEMLQCVLEARRLNLRTANRRWRRRNGMTLHGA